ncbi:hypothetical protein LIA77_11498 [Sarocladium implicatum]|nr:hypothetical protein LIA77_11498 [Sarocladium implicatum]
MAEFPAFRDVDEVENEEDHVPTFDVQLFEPGHAVENFRLRNDALDPWQREDIVERRGATHITCRCVNVVHGNWEPDSDLKGTLIVLEFQYYPRTHKRRIKLAEMEFIFSSMDNVYRNYPEVHSISLNGSHGLAPTKWNEEITKGGEGTIGGGALGVEIGTTLKWEKKISQEATDMAFVSGARYRDPTAVRYPNVATWSLQENGTKKSGVPTKLRVGILLRRRNDDDFQCKFVLRTSADFKTQFSETFKKHEGVDALLFKTSKPPVDKKMKCDRDNLGSFNLADVEDVVMFTSREA